MKNGIKILFAAWICSMWLMLDSVVAYANVYTSGDYEYELINGGKEVQIRHYLGTDTEITIPSTLDGKPVKLISEDEGDGFCKDGFLTSVVISDGIEKIGAGEFSNNANLETIVIPDSVNEIGGGAFSDTKWMTNQQMNSPLVVVNGILIDGSAYTEENLTIPEQVVSIGDGAFWFCSNLKTVEIPSGLLKIENSAFGWCENLENIIIPESIEYIGPDAFVGTPWLRKQKEGKELVVVSDIIIDGTACTESELVIPEGVKAIVDYAFEDCTTIKKVTIPKGVKSIGSSTFYGCYNLEEIVLPSTVTSIDIWAFAGCKKLKSINLPFGMTYISGYSFQNCDSLTSIAIPETVDYIDMYAFSYCDGLTSVVIPENVTSIEDLAFHGSNLTKIVILGDEVRIVNGAFGDVSKVTVYANEGSVTAQNAKNAGYNVLPLSEADLPNNDAHQHVFSEEWTIDKEATCKETGSKSHHCTDESCTEKTDVTEIPKTDQHTYDSGVVKNEATCVEKGKKVYTCTVCKGIKEEDIAATKVHTYDEGVMDTLPTCIKEGKKVYTCKVCKGTKTEVVAATGVHVYGKWVETKEATCNKAGEKVRICTSCEHQETTVIPATGFVKGGVFEKGNSIYTIKTIKGKKGTVVYEGPTKNNKKTVKIPKTVKISGKTYTVTEISDKAFKGNTKLKSVTIPEGVTKIGKEAFSGCKNLKTITIKSTKLKSIGKNAIKGIDKKATIKVPKKQLSKYKKLFKSKTGYKKTMKIKK